MKRPIVILASLLVLGLPGALIVACGDNAGGIVIDLGALGGTALTAMKTESSTKCGANCTGGFFPSGGAKVTIAVAGGTAGDFSVTMNPGPLETYTSTQTGSTPINTLVTQFLSDVNAPSANGYGQAAAAGEFWVIPFNPDPTGTSFAVSPGTTEGSISYVETDNTDAFAFLKMMRNFSDNAPTDQALVDQAVTDGRISAAASTDRTVTITGLQSLACDAGDASLATTYSVDIDGTEAVTATHTMRIVQDFNACEITGNLLGNGGSNETLIVDGRITVSFDYDALPNDTSTVQGTLTLDHSQSADAALQWGGTVTIDAEEVTGTSANGGVCLDGGITMGADDTVSDDDRCDNTTGRFVTGFYLLN